MIFASQLRYLVTVLLVLSGLVLSPMSSAGETEEVGQNDATEVAEVNEFTLLKQASQSRINEVLTQDDFNSTEDITRWRLKGSTEGSSREEVFPDWVINVLEFLESIAPFFEGLAGVIEVMMWALVAGLVLYVVLNYRRSIANWIGGLDGKSSIEPLPTSMFGLDVRQESLPANVLQQVRRNWYDGHKREGIALLFRATLTSLIHDYGCRFKSGDTEMECYRRVQVLVNDFDKNFQAPKAGLEGFMADLVTSWQSTAYAHRPPEEESFEKLCRTWEQVL